VNERHYSCAVGAVCCERCHCDAQQRRYGVTRAQPTKYSPPRPKPTPYAKFVYRVWDAIERITGRAPVVLRPGAWCSWCPVCLDAIVELQFSCSTEPGFVARCPTGCSSLEVLTVIAAP
jgi:hypothetical protein